MFHIWSRHDPDAPCWRESRQNWVKSSGHINLTLIWWFSLSLSLSLSLSYPSDPVIMIGTGFPIQHMPEIIHGVLFGYNVISLPPPETTKKKKKNKNKELENKMLIKDSISKSLACVSLCVCTCVEETRLHLSVDSNRCDALEANLTRLGDTVSKSFPSFPSFPSTPTKLRSAIDLLCDTKMQLMLINGHRFNRTDWLGLPFCFLFFVFFCFLPASLPSLFYRRLNCLDFIMEHNDVIELSTVPVWLPLRFFFFFSVVFLYDHDCRYHFCLDFFLSLFLSLKTFIYLYIYQYFCVCFVFDDGVSVGNGFFFVCFEILKARLCSDVGYYYLSHWQRSEIADRSCCWGKWAPSSPRGSSRRHLMSPKTKQNRKTKNPHQEVKERWKREASVHSQ